MAGAGGGEGRARRAPHLERAAVRVMREGDMATMDFDEARVRVYADESDTVTRAPSIG